MGSNPTGPATTPLVPFCRPYQQPGTVANCQFKASFLGQSPRGKIVPEDASRPSKLLEIAAIGQPQGTLASGKIVPYLTWMIREGYKPQTVQSHSQILRLLARKANLDDPESVRTYLVQANVMLGRKENVANVYARFAKWLLSPLTGRDTSVRITYQRSS